MVLLWIGDYRTMIKLLVFISVRLSVSMFLLLLLAIDCLIVIVSIRSTEETAISAIKTSSSVASPLSTSEGLFSFHSLIFLDTLFRVFQD